MKNTALAFLVLAILSCASCKKSETNYGSWTYQSTTYSASSCLVNAGNLTASSSANGTAYLTVSFFVNKTPATNGTYTVSSAADSSNQVTLYMQTANDSAWVSTGGNGSNQTVTVTVSNGNLNIKGANIEMQNTATLADSAVLNFNITQ